MYVFVVVAKLGVTISAWMADCIARFLEFIITCPYTKLNSCGLRKSWLRKYVSETQVNTNTGNHFCALTHCDTKLTDHLRNYIHYNVWDEITYPFPNFNSAMISPQTLLDMKLLIRLGLKLIHTSKGGPRSEIHIILQLKSLINV